MELEDARLLIRTWMKSYPDHNQDLVDWLFFNGYKIESYYIAADAEQQKEGLEIAKKMEISKAKVQPDGQNG